jgi:hypothetical protein
MTAWQPILTAPHGKLVLVGSADNMVAMAFYHGKAWRHAHSLDPLCFEPTHWMALPEPPP